MASRTQIQNEIVLLQQAIISLVSEGTASVSVDGTSVSFYSVADIQAQIDLRVNTLESTPGLGGWADFLIEDNEGVTASGVIKIWTQTTDSNPISIPTMHHESPTANPQPIPIQTWIGRRYVLFAQEADLNDFVSLSIDNFPQFGGVAKGSNTILDHTDGKTYEYWRTTQPLTRADLTLDTWLATRGDR